MAMAIKSPPVLEGEDARYFYKVAAKMKESRSKEEVRKSYQETLAFLAKYDNPYKDVKIED